MSLNGSTVLFAPYGRWDLHEQVNVYLGLGLLARGKQVLAVRCDGLYRDMCYITVNDPDRTRSCFECSLMGDSLYQRYGIPMQQLRELMVDEDWAMAVKWVENLASAPEAEVWQGYPVGAWASMAACSYFILSSASHHLPQVQAMRRQYMVYSVVTLRAIERLYMALQPAKVVMFAGGGLALSAARASAARHGISVLTHERGRREGGFMFTMNQMTSAFWPRFMLAKAWERVPVTEDQLQEIHQQFVRQRGGATVNRDSFYGTIRQEGNVRDRLRIPPDARVVGFFTSSEYEKSNYPEYHEVPWQTDILRALCAYAKGRPEFFVVRHHPNIGRGLIPDSDTLTASYDLVADLPPNVRLVMPLEPITSYDVLGICDAVIAPFSTIGLEAIAMGIPTAYAADCLYAPGSRRVLTEFSAEALGSMIEALLSLGGMLPSEELRHLYRFMRTFMFKLSVNFKRCAIVNSSMHLAVEAWEQVMPGADPELDWVCSAISDEGPLYRYPSAADYQGDCDKETAFIADIHVENGRRLRYSSVTAATGEGTAIVDVIQVFSGVYRQRHTSVALLPVLPEERHMDWWELLGRAANRRQGEYVTVHHPLVQVEEGFVSSALAVAPNHIGAAGIRSPTWIRDADVGIRRVVGKPGQRWSDPESIQQQLPCCLEPLILCATTVFRWEHLLRFLSDAANHEAHRLVSWIFSPDVVPLEVPYVAVRNEGAPPADLLSSLERSVTPSPQDSHMVHQIRPGIATSAIIERLQQ